MVCMCVAFVMLLLVGVWGFWFICEGFLFVCFFLGCFIFLSVFLFKVNTQSPCLKANLISSSALLTLQWLTQVPARWRFCALGSLLRSSIMKHKTVPISYLQLSNSDLDRSQELSPIPVIASSISINITKIPSCFLWLLRMEGLLGKPKNKLKGIWFILKSDAFLYEFCWRTEISSTKQYSTWKIQAVLGVKKRNG